MRLTTSLLALPFIGFFATILPANSQPTTGLKCGIPNQPNSPKRCASCEKTSTDSGADASNSSLGPSAHVPSDTPTCAVESPDTVIGVNHGGALLETTDLVLRSAASGVPMDFVRYYNSRHGDGYGDAMGHGRTLTHSFSWRMTAPGDIRRIYTPTGREMDFTFSQNSTYLGQASALYVPSKGNGERLHNVGNFWHLVMPGGAAHTFERVVNEDTTVLFHPRNSKDTRGNTITYTTDTAARITKATDALENSIDLSFSQISLNRKSAVALHTVSSAPQVGWNEVIIPAGDAYRWVQVVAAPGMYYVTNEIEFYESDGSGGYTKLNGSVYGTNPTKSNNRTYHNAFDGDTSTQFVFGRPNNGIAGIDLGASNTATVTKIRYFIASAVSGELNQLVGMRFEGMVEQPEFNTVLTGVTASTGDSVEYQYDTHVDESIGQNHTVLDKVVYTNAADQITDEATLTWITNQQGVSPCVLRAREPRSTLATPDIAFEYYPVSSTVKGQPYRVLTGDPSSQQLIQLSEPLASTRFIAPDGGLHRINNSNSNSYLPTSSVDAAGKTISYSWTSTHFLSSKTTPAGTTTFTRNAIGQPLVTTYPNGLKVTNTYDSLGRLLTSTRSATGETSRPTTYTRESNGRIIKITNPDNSYQDFNYNSLGLLESVRETNGSFTVHTYDTTVGSPTAGLRLTTTTGLASSSATGGETTTFTYHLPGNASNSPARLLASQTTPRGRTTSYEYDHAGRPLKTTYPDGSINQIVRDEFGNKIMEFDGTSTEEWTYDQFRRPTSHTNALGGVTTYNYGPNGTSCGCYGSGGPTLITSPAGRQTLRSYDLMGRVVTETQGNGTADAAITTNSYDLLGRTTQVIDPDGFITKFIYNSMGRVTSTTAAFNVLNLTTNNTYNAFSETLTTTSPGGRTSSMTYDVMGRTVTMTDPLGTVTFVTYDAAGRQTSVTEAYGTGLARTTSFAYDVHNRLVTTTYPDSTTTTQTYHPGGETYTFTDELGRTSSSDSSLVTWTDSYNQTWTSFAQTSTDPAGFTSTSYGPPMSYTGGTSRMISPAGRISESYSDALGRAILIRSGLVAPGSGLTPDVSDTAMTYDPDGLMLTSTTDPGGLNQTSSATYDALGRTKTSTDPLNRTTSFTYNKRGNRLTTTLPDNRVESATYDALGRMVSSTDPKNQTIAYTYWYETGQQLTLTDARTNITNWTYNLRGQLLTKVYPNGDDHAYSYDTLGRMATHTTPNNHVCTYTYDVRDRQTLANWNTTTPDTVREYFANGLLKSIDNGVSKSDYAYNNRTLLTSETQTLDGRTAKIVSYEYDADGLRTDLGYPTSPDVTYQWTARAQLKNVSADGPPPLATYTYDKAGRNTALVHENGITQSKSYDAANQLLANTHLKNGSPVSGHAYTLDTTGRRTGELRSGDIPVASSYGYDAADQVTAANYGSGLTDSYAYDAMGNRTTAAIASQGGTAKTYTPNNVNQYTSITGFTAPTHDANGNQLINGNGAFYTWDSENRLLTVAPTAPAIGDKMLVHNYDANHRRVATTIREWGISGWYDIQCTHFIYDGWNVIEEHVSPNLSSPSSVLTKVLTWGSDLSGSLQGAGGVGGLLMVEEITSSTTTAYHFQYDGNGNVTEITDASGNPAASYRYDAFGNTLVATGSYAATNKYRFSTKPINNEVTSARLYYYGYRYYDAVTGRWPSRDPIEEEGGINLYGFVGNDGVNQWDLLGLWSNLVRERSKNWATICADEGDTWDQLADLLNLEVNEAGAWVKNYDASPEVGKTYEIPNTVVAFGVSDISDPGFFWIYNWVLDRMVKYMSYYESKGFKVVQRLPNNNDKVFIESWNEDGLYSLMFGGHGLMQRDIIKTGNRRKPKVHVYGRGVIVGKKVVDASMVHPLYKLASLHMLACGSAYSHSEIIDPRLMKWQRHVSKNGGRFEGFLGLVNRFNFDSNHVDITY